MPSLRAYREDGTEVLPGDIVTDFRGDTAIFHRATRAPDGHRTGKVQTGGPSGSEAVPARGQRVTITGMAMMTRPRKGSYRTNISIDTITIHEDQE